MRPTSPPITGLDHLLIGVQHLELARDTWEKLGFTVTPRGRHIGWGTANYCIMFERDYVELLGIVDPEKFTNDLDRFLEEREGALGLAFATTDAARAAAELQARGIAAEDPVELKRLLELPGGDVEPAFRLVHLAPEATPGLGTFLCDHLSRDLVWQPQWTRHANTVLGIDGLFVVAQDIPALLPAYKLLFGEDAVVCYGEDAAWVQAAGCKISFTTPGSWDSLFDRAPEPPYIAGVDFFAQDLSETAACLRRAGVGFQSGGDATRWLQVEPQEANGVCLRIVQTGDVIPLGARASG